MAIGSSNGVITSTGKLSDVNWAANSKYLGVEIDPKGGNNFIQLGISQLLSVPYSLYSISSKDGLPSLKGHTGKILTNNGIIPRWDTLHIPNYTSGAGLNITKEHITITDTALFNASKILNGSIDITGRQNNNVLSWDSINNKYRYVPVEIISGPNKKFLQNGNSFGTKAVLGTIDNYDLDFIRNNTIVGSWNKIGELNSKYFTQAGSFWGCYFFAIFSNDPL
ncbi:MAG: hypothetical protein IPP79_03340 [Chitinophagaceae bacterium]|nr:hypothetical protein [Chitinophagaceae bacterium]